MVIYILRVLIEVFLFWLIAMSAILIHETGHMLGYQLGTNKCRWFIRVGTGKRILKTKRLHIHVLPFGGYFHMPDEFDFETTKECLRMLFGGPVFSLLTALFLFALQGKFFAGNLSERMDNWRSVLIFMRNYNFFLFLISIIPMRYSTSEEGLKSDGFYILKALREK